MCQQFQLFQAGKHIRQFTTVRKIHQSVSNDNTTKADANSIHEGYVQLLLFFLRNPLKDIMLSKSIIRTW